MVHDLRHLGHPRHAGIGRNPGIFVEMRVLFVKVVRMYRESVRSRSLSARCFWPAAVVASLLALGSAGCGSGGLATGDAGENGGNGDGGKNLSLFIGTWQPTSGSETVTCAGQAQTDTITDNTVWQMGTSSDLVQPPDSSGCSLLANVSGNTATALPHQSCTQTMTGLTLTLTVTSYTFTVAAGGTTATEMASGTAVTSGTASLTCTVTESAMYKKAP